jgi:5,10-methenyltetrahydromethanopterin hydrogenase
MLRKVLNSKKKKEIVDMLDKTQIKAVVVDVAQYEQDDGNFAIAKVKRETSWKTLLARLNDYEVEDGDQEIIIAGYKSEYGTISNKIIRDIHRAFAAIGVISKDIPTTKRKRVIEETAEGNTKVTTYGTGTKRVDTALEVEAALAEGSRSRAKKIVLDKLWQDVFPKLGSIIRDHYDLVSIEDAFDYGVESYIPFWHKRHDAAIEQEKKEERRKRA